MKRAHLSPKCRGKKAGKIVAPTGRTYREHIRVVRSPQASRFQERDRRRQPGAGEHIAGRGAPARRGGRRGRLPRSEERRGGQEWVSTCRSRWSPSNSKKKDNAETKRTDQMR